MIKKLTSFAICFLLMLSVPVTVFAVEPEILLEQSSSISLQYVNVSEATSTLAISSNGKATIKGYVKRTKSGTSIDLECTLQRYTNGSWKDIESWSKSSTSSKAIISEKYTVSKGTYRVETCFSVDGTGDTESGTVYSENVTY